MKLLILLWSLAASGESILSKSRFFTDANGGVVFLRGVNISGAFKTPPFTEKFKASDFEPLVKTGINSIRLVFIWEAFEPEKEEYDDKYFEWYRSLIAEAGKRKLKVIVDFHQDAFSRFTTNGCGDGFPKWAVSGTPVEPDNGPKCKNWGDVQLTHKDFKQSFNDFYAGKNEVRQRYLLLWKKLAETFKGNDTVIGYDLINEPYGDWNSQLLPLYTDAAAVIHAIDPQKIIFVEPTMGRVSIGPGLEMSAGMKRPTFSNFAFAPHYYDLQMLATGRIFFDFTSSEMDKIAAIGKAWNVPVWIGEFSGPLGKEDANYMEKLYSNFDRLFFSMAQWTYVPTWNPTDMDGWNGEDVSIIDDKGNFKNYRVRAYAKRVAGIPTKMSESKKSYTLEWLNEPDAKETIIFAPKRGEAPLFKGAKVETHPKQLACEYDEEGTKLHCRSNQKGPHKVVIF